MYSKLKTSLIGRVNVIKTLALPKLVYLFTVLPSPPAFLLNSIEKRFKDFLWNKGVVKIHNRQLEKDIPEGGLKLINLSDFNKALKLSWLKRLLTGKGSWQNIFEVSNRFSPEIILNLDQKSFLEMVENCSNPFWKDALQIWGIFKTNFAYKEDCRKYPLWGTYFIKNSNLDRKASEMISKGVIHVNDLFTNTGQLIGYYDFMETFNIELNFVDFYSMTHAIPRQWLKGQERKLNPHEIKQCLLNKLVQEKRVSKWAYQKIRSSDKFCRGHEAKWANILKIDIPESDWSKIYVNNKHSVIKTSLMSFQYQILTRTIPTNSFLVKCKLVDSDKCWFCKENTETIEHLFWYCPVVKTFWFRLLDKINASTDFRSNMVDKNVILGAVEGRNKDVLNFFFTVVKKYVYNVKCKESQLSVESCKNLFKYYYSMEHCVVTNEFGSIRGFSNKWEVLSSLI